MAAPKGNKYGIGNEGGRPPIYDKPDDLIQKVAEFFRLVDSEELKPSVTGLALFLGFSSKSTLYEYANKEGFSYSVKRALLLIENHYELKLDGNSVTGVIFALKNMGWSDKQELEHSGGTTSTSLEKLSFEDLYLLKYGKKPE